MAEETINISDGAAVKVVKGGAKLSKEEHDKKLEETPAEKEPVRDTLVARVYLELIDFLKQRAVKTNQKFDDVINSLLIDATRMHIHKKCPYCLQLETRNLKLQRDNYKLQNMVAKHLKKRKHRLQKEARKVNRGK